jgi:hypothetical protein
VPRSRRTGRASSCGPGSARRARRMRRRSPPPTPSAVSCRGCPATRLGGRPGSTGRTWAVAPSTASSRRCRCPARRACPPSKLERGRGLRPNRASLRPSAGQAPLRGWRATRETAWHPRSGAEPAERRGTRAAAPSPRNGAAPAQRSSAGQAPLGGWRATRETAWHPRGRATVQRCSGAAVQRCSGPANQRTRATGIASAETETATTSSEPTA